MRIGFLFNHEANHQIAHTLPIAASLAARGVKVEVLASSPAQQEAAQAIVPLPALPHNPVRFTLLSPGPLAQAADTLLRHISPFRRLAVLRHNLPTLAAFDALVVPETTTSLLRTRYGLQKPTLIYLPHGAGDGAAGFGAATRHFDLVLLPGERVAARMRQADLVTPGRHAIVGYPKFAVASAGPRPDYFSNGRPTVLYNPHFNPLLSSWYTLGPAVLDWFASQHRFNLIFAPHVMLFRRRLHTSLIHRRMRLRPAIPRRLRTHSGMLLDPGSPSSVDMRHVRAADIYLGDVSSQIYEWIAIPRPAIFFNTHEEAWQDKPDYRFWNLGEVIRSVAELPAALARAMAEPHACTARQQAAAAETFSITARPAAERAADAIEAYMRGEPVQAIVQ